MPATLGWLQKHYPWAETDALPIRLPFGRMDLVKMFARLKFMAGAEIGVEEGLYTEALCNANPSATIFAVDAWVSYPGYRESMPAAKVAQYEATARTRLKAFEKCKILKGFSVDMAQAVPDGLLDFVYIDANHEEQAVRADLSAWVPKVKSGGIVAGHDFRTVSPDSAVKYGVVEAVTGFTKAQDISPWFVLTGDRIPSWLWVQP